MSFAIGQRVKYSGHVINQKRDYWNQCGREPMKSGAREALDKAVALRGTVTEILSNGVAVQTDDGCQHRSLGYLWMPAE